MYYLSENNSEQPPVSHDGGAPLVHHPFPPPRGNHHLQVDQEPHHHDHESGGCRGIWICLCFQDLQYSYRLNHHQTPPRSLSSCMSDCCRLTPHALSDQQIKKSAEKFTENKPTVRVYCKDKTDYSLTIRDGKVILAPSNVSDPHQHWIKDEKFGINVKDEQGFSSFALVNKATGQAVKHSIGITYPVQLLDYNPDKVDKSVLWSMSENKGGGYKAIRAVDNIHLSFDGLGGDKKGGGVRDGTKIVLWEFLKGDNQMWTIAHY